MSTPTDFYRDHIKLISQNLMLTKVEKVNFYLNKDRF